jgi:hypothetical protein
VEFVFKFPLKMPWERALSKLFKDINPPQYLVIACGKVVHRKITCPLYTIMLTILQKKKKRNMLP